MGLLTLTRYFSPSIAHCHKPSRWGPILNIQRPMTTRLSFGTPSHCFRGFTLARVQQLCLHLVAACGSNPREEIRESVADPGWTACDLKTRGCVVWLGIGRLVEVKREGSGHPSLGFGIWDWVVHLSLEPYFSKDSPDFVKGASGHWVCRTIKYERQEWKGEIASARGVRRRCRFSVPSIQTPIQHWRRGNSGTAIAPSPSTTASDEQLTDFRLRPHVRLLTWIKCRNPLSLPRSTSIWRHQNHCRIWSEMKHSSWFINPYFPSGLERMPKKKKKTWSLSWPGYRTVWFANERTQAEKWRFEKTAFVDEFWGGWVWADKRGVYVLLLSCTHCARQYWFLGIHLNLHRT